MNTKQTRNLYTKPMDTKQTQNLYTKQTRNFWFSVGLVFLFSVGLAQSVKAAGASLYLAPSQGTFFVGSTFSVSVYVDTKNQKINAVELDLKFPPEILQVTSPTATKSFISEWIVPPSYSNSGGTISFKGGMPEGIMTSSGLVSTITFRAKSSGKAKIEILDSSKLLLSDGKGTPIFTTNINGVYEILIPHPEGPKIMSLTHPDSDLWYSDSNPSFFWEKAEWLSNFSFSFSQNPKEVPDTVSEGEISFKSYTDVADGIWYFHLRAKKQGIWGKTSHFSVKIDKTPPQKFVPQAETYSRFIYFETQDSHSGIDYYEVSVRDLNQIPIQQPFFTEAVSPLRMSDKKQGKYSVIIRAYDRAGNWQEGEVRFQLIAPFVSYIEGRGIQVKGVLFPWWIIYFIITVLILGTGSLIFYFSTRGRFGFKKGIKEIREALDEIKKIEQREMQSEQLKQEFKKEKQELEEKLKHETEHETYGH
ncbi:hypothetical protein KAS79_03860 [Candidatus Parcubacteria bacterium]|nr:hypothetical protein [Candidatus Parcubacteria bacterium]